MPGSCVSSAVCLTCLWMPLQTRKQYIYNTMLFSLFLSQGLPGIDGVDGDAGARGPQVYTVTNTQHTNYTELNITV